MAEPLVIAENASRRFGSGPTAVDAVIDVSCQVEPNDRIAIVGPSGSGKSTLLHLLGNLDQPTSGTVAWPALGVAEALRPSRVVDIFQGPSLIPVLSVSENVRLPLLLAGTAVADADAIANEALAMFEVAHLRDKLPEELSGGQAQRVSIARAIAVRPWLILADEPTGQLDSATAIRVMSRLLRAADELGAALIVSTHDARIADRLSTVWSMAGGRLTTSPAGQGWEVPRASLGSLRPEQIHEGVPR